MGARLARYTANDTYAKVAESTWDWMMGIGFIDPTTMAIYDGAHVETNCTDIDKQEFSYNNAVLTQGAAFMYNYASRSRISSRDALNTNPQLDQWLSGMGRQSE